MNMTETETAYVAAYSQVIDAVMDCTKYVSSALAEHVADLETRIPADRIGHLQEVARR